MSVLLDIGAHDGQTLQAVTSLFDRIYAFEPMPAQFSHLVEQYDNYPNVTLCNFGLADSTGERKVYGTNESMEASLYPDKFDADESVVTVCEFRKASDVFADLPYGLTVKLNCEGAEVEIFNDLIDSGQIWKIANVLVDFDVRKIPGMEHLEAQTLARLKAIGFDRYCSWPPGETHQDRIRAWLS